MAKVTYPEGSYREGQRGYEPFDIPDNRPDLVAYYRSEGATVVAAGEEDVDGVPEVVDIDTSDTGDPLNLDSLDHSDIDSEH